MDAGSLLPAPADPIGDAQSKWAELLVEQAQWLPGYETGIGSTFTGRGSVVP